LSQFVFSGAADHINFDQREEYQYSIGFGNAVRFMAREFNKSGLMFTNGKSRIDNMVNLSFCYPNEFNFLDSQYKIGYMPWESTSLRTEWKDRLNQCDEVWTTSQWSKQNLDNILDKETFVYEHGIPSFCKPIKRKRKDVIRFLHIGEPAVRKGGQDVVDSFAKLFGNNPDYQLVMKCSGINATRIYDQTGVSIGTPASQYNNIVVIEDYFSEDMLLQLYKKCDIFIYPSYGEGFGFNAAYAIAMGMPTICTSEWAPYKDFISAPLDGTYVDSPWPNFHEGQMIQPDLEQMEQYMIDISENYDKYLKDSFSTAIAIHKRFDWNNVSKKPISRLKKIISMTSKH
jgi:glycosyltransferase involved in cell wall biosynthesis